VDLRLLRYFVAVAEQRHVGRAASRLHMSQPPLSRAVRQLEVDLGVVLFDRTPKGVTLTTAGVVLFDEARALLNQADRARTRVTTAAETPKIAVGTLADTAEQVGSGLVAAFRAQHPHVAVTIHEGDLGDPTAGLRVGAVDVALTRAPFDDADITTLVLRVDPVGVVLHADDPLARRSSVALGELHDRTWVRLPEGIDPRWTAYWSGGRSRDDLPVARTIQECLQSVLWSRVSALAPMNQALPAGLVNVPVVERSASELVVAWKPSNSSPLARSFVQVAASECRPSKRR
jgi:DNA-binding transcriptional LysR family regulator